MRKTRSSTVPRRAHLRLHPQKEIERICDQRKGLKSRETAVVVELSADMYFHFFTAAMADSARIGLPPRTRALSTLPFELMVTSNRTVPPICRIFSTGG